MQGLDTAYPKDMRGVNVVPDWSPEMYTNTAGFVDQKDPKTIHVNALNAATSDQPTVDWIAGHELEHVRQFKSPWQKALANVENILPYEHRPYEHQAEAAADKYMDTERAPTNRDQTMPTVGGRFFYDLGKSPAVDSLLGLLKR